MGDRVGAIVEGGVFVAVGVVVVIVLVGEGEGEEGGVLGEAVGTGVGEFVEEEIVGEIVVGEIVDEGEIVGEKDGMAMVCVGEEVVAEGASDLVGAVVDEAIVGESDGYAVGAREGEEVGRRVVGEKVGREDVVFAFPCLAFAV